MSAVTYKIYSIYHLNSDAIQTFTELSVDVYVHLAFGDKGAIPGKSVTADSQCLAKKGHQIADNMIQIMFLCTCVYTDCM